MNNLSDDPEDDAPVKVAYHRAPVLDKPDKPEELEEPEDTIAAKAPIDEDPLDNEDSEEEPAEDDEKDPLEEEEPEEPEESAGQRVSGSAEPEESEDEPASTAKPVDVAEIAGSADSADSDLYYLETVKAGEQPEWQKPKEDLNVFSQPIDDGLMQYWAYPKNSGKTAEDIPNAEAIAKTHQSDNPVIIIDQVKTHLTPGCCLELILAKNGHALAKTDTNLDNLEANISSLIEIAKNNFGITTEHFISTSNVSTEVERRLDDLEDAEDGEETALGHQITTSGNSQNTPLIPADQPILAPKEDRSKIAVFIPVLLLIIIGGLMVYYRHNLLAIINPPKQEAQITPAPVLSPTPTPTPSIDRSKFTVRVLNGTPKTGAAGVLADKLKEKGWLIDKTGNATSSAIAESYVRGKVDTTEAMKILIADVTDYQASTSSVILKPSDKADLEFVIGKK